MHILSFELLYKVSLVPQHIHSCRLRLRLNYLGLGPLTSTRLFSWHRQGNRAIVLVTSLIFTKVLVDSLGTYAGNPLLSWLAKAAALQRISMHRLDIQFCSETVYPVALLPAWPVVQPQLIEDCLQLLSYL